RTLKFIPASPPPDPPPGPAGESLPFPPAPNSAAPVSPEVLLDLLAVASEAREPGAELRIKLPRVRQSLGVSPAVVRLVGSRLQVWGILRESGRDESGAFWRLDTDLLRTVWPGPKDPGRRAALSALWSEAAVE
ncbi:MAG: hypothetical protein L3K15_03300, partial [Thermoplasmata archaeon]|nr:hypothetical protein [Thermoplasmata archaeon]